MECGLNKQTQSLNWQSSHGYMNGIKFLRLSVCFLTWNLLESTRTQLHMGAVWYHKHQVLARTALSRLSTTGPPLTTALWDPALPETVSAPISWSLWARSALLQKPEISAPSCAPCLTPASRTSLFGQRLLNFNLTNSLKSLSSLDFPVLSKHDPSQTDKHCLQKSWEMKSKIYRFIGKSILNIYQLEKTK